MSEPTLITNRDWLTKLHQGIHAYFVALGLEILLGRAEMKHGGPVWLWACLGLLPVALEFFGMWLVTTPEPQHAEAEVPRCVRLATRGVALFSMLLQVIDALGIAMGFWNDETWMIIALPMLAIHTISFALHLGNLARRLQRTWLIWQTYVSFGGLSASLFGFTACLPFLAVLGENQMPNGPLLTVLIAIFVPLILLAIWALVLLYCYQSAFTAVAKQLETETNI